MIRHARPILLLAVAGIVCLFFVIHFQSSSKVRKPVLKDQRVTSFYVPPKEGDDLVYDKDLLAENGDTIMPELGNATIKAELGRSAWRVIHTMASRFPVSPTEDEQNAIKSFIKLFSRLYPCGQCARHFQGLLVELPPKVDSRDSISQWACTVHNKVNERLKKPIFDCKEVLSHWKCGCDDATD